MNILHIFRAPVGGLLKHVLDVSDGLVREGHKIFMVFSDDSNISESDIARVQGVTNGDYLRLPMLRLPFVTDLLVVYKIARWLQGKNIDVVHGHGAKGGVYARLMALFNKRTRIVYTPHGGVLHYKNNYFLGWIFSTVERWLSGLTDCFLFESDFARREFLDFVCDVDDKSLVVHNALKDSDFIASSGLARTVDFIFLGELRALKGVDVFLKAVKCLNDSNYFPRCYIYGDGPDSEYFKKMKDDLNLSCVDFKGRTADPISALASAKCFVLTSYAESLPYVVLEAVATKTPVLATSVGGVPEILHHPRNFFPPGDYFRLSELMIDCMANYTDYSKTAEDEFLRARSSFSYSVFINKVMLSYARGS